jgi:serine/threonine-protein kinase RsbW
VDNGRRPGFRFALGSDRHDALALRRDFSGWLADAGVDDQARFEVTLACWEAVANAIEHPLTPTSPIVDVKAELTKQELIVTVRDYGAWREQRRRNAGGLGLPLMRSMTDSVAIDHRPEGTWITLRRQLEPAAS